MTAIFLVVLVAAALLVGNHVARQRIRRVERHTLATRQIMEKALEIASNFVVIYDLRTRMLHRLNGYMVPDEGITLDVYKQHVHPDDLQRVLTQLSRVISGELPSVEFSYRWNFDFTGQAPRWGILHNVSVAEYQDGVAQPVSLISTLVDETEVRRQQAEEEELSNRYKLIFENSIIGLSFYSADGWLLNSNRIMRQICNFDSDEGDAFFEANNLFDMPPFNEIVDRNNVEEFWACAQSIIPERDMHSYLEIRLRPVRDDQGRLMVISVSARDVTEEREMYLRIRENDQQLQRANESIQLYETELRYMMENLEMQAWRASLERNCIEFFSGLSTVVRTFSLDDLPSIFVNQDDDFVRALANPAEAFSRPLFYVGKMQPVVTGKKHEQQWVQINSIPEYDKNGRMVGAFGVWRNLMKLMQKQEQLRRETERANDSGRMKSVFLANMTHEIRTPLNAIVGFSDLLQGMADSDERRELLRIIHNNCDMLLRLINDILVLSNVDANAMQMMPEEVDFAHEFDDICQSLAQRVTEPGVEFLTDNPCSSLVVSIDKARIQQVITNFVTNAVKYTTQGHIKVGYRLEAPCAGAAAADSHDTAAAADSHDTAAAGAGGARTLYVYCEDTGAGIPADQRSRVFERFVKLNDFVQGTGLGLSICKAIIDRCGGTIGVDSEEGNGSTFWFRLPVLISK